VSTYQSWIAISQGMQTLSTGKKERLRA